MTIAKQYLIPAVTLVVGLVIGTAAGATGAPEPEPAPAVTMTASPEPAPTVTVTAEPEIIEQGLPQDCIDALGAADSLMGVSADFSRLVARHMREEQKAWTEVADGNWGYLPTYTDQMEDFTSEVLDLTAQIEASDYAALKAACLEPRK